MQRIIPRAAPPLSRCATPPGWHVARHESDDRQNGDEANERLPIARDHAATPTGSTLCCTMRKSLLARLGAIGISAARSVAAT